MPKHRVETGDPYLSSSYILKSSYNLGLETLDCPCKFGANGEEGIECDDDHGDDDEDAGEAGEVGEFVFLGVSLGRTECKRLDFECFLTGNFEGLKW